MIWAASDDKPERTLDSGPLSVRSKVWLLNRDGQHVFGSGLADLLETLAGYGSLAGATRHLRVSYRKAWGLIKRAEEHFGCKLIHTISGGPRGGGSSLTEHGRKILELYHELNLRVAVLSNEEFARLYEKVLEDE